jgi:hypothetical protein
MSAMMNGRSLPRLTAARVVGDVGDGDRQRRVVALHHVAQRIADQQGVDAGAVEQAREAGVVAGEHDDLLAGGMEPGEIGLGQAAGDALSGHGRVMTGRRTAPRIHSAGHKWSGLDFGCRKKVTQG